LVLQISHEIFYVSYKQGNIASLRGYVWLV